MRILSNQQAFFDGYHTGAIKGASISELLKYNAYSIGQSFPIDAANHFIKTGRQVGYSALGAIAREEYESYCKSHTYQIHRESDKYEPIDLKSDPAVPYEDWSSDEWWSDAA